MGKHQGSGALRSVADGVNLSALRSVLCLVFSRASQSDLLYLRYLVLFRLSL